MTRITFGGILIWPEHPLADMHGYVRGVCRTKDLNLVNEQVRSFDAVLAIGTWAPTKSAVEWEVGNQNYGRLMVCSISEMYQRGEYYHRAEKQPDTKAKIFQEKLRDPRIRT